MSAYANGSEVMEKGGPNAAYQQLVKTTSPAVLLTLCQKVHWPSQHFGSRMSSQYREVLFFFLKTSVWSPRLT